MVPLGYHTNERRITVNESEADRVRIIFRSYLNHGSLNLLATGHSYHLIATCRQLPDPEITSPNSCQVVPSNFCNCICLMGAKSLALVGHPNVRASIPSSVGVTRTIFICAEHFGQAGIK
jgi:hypothetical protein